MGTGVQTVRGWPCRVGKFNMSVLGIGVDMVEVERIQHSLDRFGERFMKRVFTDGEIAYCVSMKFPSIGKSDATRSHSNSVARRAPSQFA